MAVETVQYVLQIAKYKTASALDNHLVNGVFKRYFKSTPQELEGWLKFRQEQQYNWNIIWFTNISKKDLFIFLKINKKRISMKQTIKNIT